MILACGVCTHWILWATFPAATSWAVIFAAWFATLAVVFRSPADRLAGVPAGPGAVALVLGSLVLGVTVLGPVAGWWFAPSCVLASLQGSLSSRRPRARKRVAVLITVAAVATLAASFYGAERFEKSLAKAAKVAMLEGTPAWSIVMRQVSRGDCATLGEILVSARTERVQAAVRERLKLECGRLQPAE